MENATDIESDQALALRARTERDAFGLLYDRYVTRIYRYCYRRFGNRHDAEDTTSAVFIRALERLETYKGGSFRAWLFAIARTSVADRYRHLPEAPFDALFEVADANECPEEHAIRAADVHAVRFMLASLSPDQREVIELRLAGLDGADIARAMNRSVDAVKMLQLRAMRRLRASATRAMRKGGSNG